MRNKSTFKSLAPYLKTYKRLFVILILAMVAVSGIQTAIPLFQQYAIDTFIAGETLSGFALFIVIYAGLLALQMLLDYVGSFNCCRIEMYVTARPAPQRLHTPPNLTHIIL